MFMPPITADTLILYVKALTVLDCTYDEKMPAEVVLIDAPFEGSVKENWKERPVVHIWALFAPPLNVNGCTEVSMQGWFWMHWIVVGVDGMTIYTFCVQKG